VKVFITISYKLKPFKIYNVVSRIPTEPEIIKLADKPETKNAGVNRHRAHPPQPLHTPHLLQLLHASQLSITIGFIISLH
jgi:hypothetical protein